MLTIQPTKKLSDQLNNELNKEKTVEKQSLYAWHAHLFFYKRKKYVMVMNNQTRYSLIIGNLLKKDFMRFDDLIKSSIQDIFMADQFDGSGIQTYMANCEIVHIVPTNNRSIISQMNDSILITKHVWNNEGLEAKDINLQEQNRFNNKTPMLKLPETFPVEAMGNALEEIGG